MNWLETMAGLLSGMTWIDGAECAGAVFGLAGAYLVATHSRFSPLGWLAFIVANIALIAFALAIGRYWLLIQQVGFTGSSLLGLRRSWRSPPTAIPACEACSARAAIATNSGGPPRRAALEALLRARSRATP